MTTDSRVRQIACNACLCANVAHAPKCWRATVPACQCSKSVPTYYFYVSACHTGSQCFNLACQGAKRDANFPNIAEGTFYTLLLHKKFYILLDTIVIHTICICMVHKNRIILHFYTSCHVKEKRVDF